MQAEELEKLKKDLLTATRKLEQEKLYYYLLAKSNEQPVLIIKSPTDTKGLKNFLGYGWSSRKGSEGIKYIGSVTKSEGDEDEERLLAKKGIYKIQTPLFNPQDLNDISRINSLVRSCFLGEAVSIPEELKSYCSTLRLTDMLDFKRTDWDAAIRTVLVNSEGIQSSYPVYSLGEIVDVRIGGTPSRQISEYFRGNHPWVSIAEMNGGVITQTKEQITDDAVDNSNVKLIPKGTTLLSFKLSIGKTAIAGVDLYTNEAIAGLIPRNSGQVLDRYLHCFFSAGGLNHSTVGNKAFGKSLNKSYLENDVQIPLPPIEIQQAIVDECAKVDEEYESSRMSIEEYRERISNVFKELEIVKEGKRGGVILVIKELAHIHNEKILLSSVPIGSYISTDNMLQDKAGVVAYDGIPTIDKVTSYKVNDILISNIRPYLKKIWKADKDGGCSNDVIVLRLDDDRVHAQYLYYCLSQDAFFDYMMLGAKGVKMPRGDKKQMMNYSIPVPPLSEQERIIREVEGYEAEILKAEAVMQGVEARKSAILQKYLG